MRRRSIILLVIILLMSTTVAFGSIDDKLSNHWSKDVIDRSVLTYYFPYLAKNNFERLDPNAAMVEQEFNISVASLFKDNGYEVSGIGSEANLTRKEMVNLLGQRLKDIGITNDENINLPFKDINTMDNNSIELLRLLYKYNIIKGDSNTSFGPDRNLSQAEAIIILQRVKGVLEDMVSIPFKTLGVVQSINNQEAIVTTQEDDRVLVTITKEFPTPGYFMTIDRVAREKGGFKIYFDIKPPEPDSIQLQVITYKTITIEIEKDELGEPPYNFILDGYNKIEYREKV